MDEQKVLEAFREVTGWSDELVLHYAACGLCIPVCGSEEEDCADSPKTVQSRKFAAQRSRLLRGVQVGNGNVQSNTFR